MTVTRRRGHLPCKWPKKWLLFLFHLYLYWSFLGRASVIYLFKAQTIPMKRKRVRDAFTNVVITIIVRDSFLEIKQCFFSHVVDWTTWLIYRWGKRKIAPIWNKKNFDRFFLTTSVCFYVSDKDDILCMYSRVSTSKVTHLTWETFYIWKKKFNILWKHPISLKIQFLLFTSSEKTTLYQSTRNWPRHREYTFIRSIKKIQHKNLFHGLMSGRQ